MLIALVTWLYIAFILIGLGIGFAGLSRKWLRLEPVDAEISGLLLVFSGYSVCLLLCSVAYIFVEIGFAMHISVLALSVLSFVLFKRATLQILYTFKTALRNMGAAKLGLIVLAVLSVLTGVVSHPTNIDSGNYHVQAIAWMNAYPVIPGLGNLLVNLAYNQSSFLAEAFFSLTFLKEEPLRVLNGFLVLTVLIHSISSLKLKAESKSSDNLLHTVVVFFVMLHFRNWLSSPVPDLVIALFSYLILQEAILRIRLGQSLLFNLSLVTLVLLAVTAISIKISAAILPVVVLVLALFTPRFFTLRRTVFFTALGGGILLPWFARSVIQSGYLIFPLAGLDVFDVDWKVPKAMVEATALQIKAFSIMPFMPLEEVKALTLLDRFAIWIQRNSADRIFLFALVICAQVAYLFSLNRSAKSKQLKLLSLTIFAGILFWFVTAPDFRFVSPLLYTSIVILLYVYVPKRFIRHKYTNAAFMLFLVLALVRKIDLSSFTENTLHPEPYQRSAVTLLQGDGFSVAVPDSGTYCWNHPVPCIPFGNIKHLELRGENLSEGFRFKRNPLKR
jgi:hypothetical protein